MLLTELQIGICGDDEMIRKYVDGDIDAVMQIWLNTNIQTHIIQRGGISMTEIDGYVKQQLIAALFKFRYDR